MEDSPDPDDPAVKTAMEEYVIGLVADCPAFPPDERQKYFYSCLDEMRKEMPDSEFISMNGFRASAVDLGWIRDRVAKIVDEKLDDLGCMCVSTLVEMFITRSVQRVKTGTANHLYEIGALDVRFTTQDDEGHYDYHFLVPVSDEADEEFPEERDPA